MMRSFSPGPFSSATTVTDAFGLRSGFPLTRISPLEPPRVVSTPSGNPKLAGVIDSPPLKPGQVYQVVLYAFASIDPNVDDPDSGNQERKPNASVTVVALLKGPGEKDLIIHKEPGFGGTWFQMTVDTKVPTLLILQV